MNPKIKEDLLKAHTVGRTLPIIDGNGKHIANETYYPTVMVPPDTELEDAISGMSKTQAAETMIGLLQRHPTTPWGKLGKTVPASKEDRLAIAGAIWNEIAERWTMGLTNAQVECKFQDMQMEAYGKVFLKAELMGPDVHFRHLVNGEWQVLA